MKKDTKERVLPHSIESEQSVLGCVLIDEDATITILSDLKADDFYVEAHRIIFEAMHKIYSSQAPVDFVTLTDELERMNMLESVGGIDYITTLTNIVPSASNFEHYIDIIKRNSVLRQLISASNDIIKYSFESPEKDDAIAYAEKNIFEIGQNEERSNLTLIKDSMPEVMEKFETIQKNPDSIRGIPTGIYKLDTMMKGLQNSDLIILAARPACGKTSFAMNIVNHAAIKNKSKVAVFSLEMSKAQLAQRSLFSVAKVDMEKANQGKLSVKEWNALWAANAELVNANIYVDDSSLTNPTDILGKCRRLKRERGLDLVMIDYLQLMSTGKNKDRQQEVSEISRSLKIMAKELDVPVLVLSQLSRGTENRKDHRPMLSDLRESGSIEQDADIVWFIHRPDMYSDTSEEERNSGLAEIIVAKHRNGPVGTVTVKWMPQITTFLNLDRDANQMSMEATAPETRLEEVPDIVPLAEVPNLTDIF